MHVLRMQSSAHDLRHRFQDLNFTAGQLYALIKSHVLNVSTIGKYLQLAVCMSASRCGCTLVHSQVRTAQSRHQSQMAATHALTTFPVSSASSGGLVWEPQALAGVRRCRLWLEAALGLQEAVHQGHKLLGLLERRKVPAALKCHQYSARHSSHNRSLQ